MCKYIKDGGLIKSRERGENIGRDEKRIAGSLETRTFYRCYRFLDPSNMASTWKTLFNSLRDEICFTADCSTKYYPLRNCGNKMTLYIHKTLRLSLSFDIFKTLLLQFPLYWRMEIKCKWKWTNCDIKRNVIRK